MLIRPVVFCIHPQITVFICPFRKNRIRSTLDNLATAEDNVKPGHPCFPGQASESSISQNYFSEVPLFSG